LIIFQQFVFEFWHFYHPTGDRPEYQRVVLPPAMWVAVLVLLAFEQAALSLQMIGDMFISVKDVNAGKIGNLVSIISLLIDRHDYFNAVGLANNLVFLTKTRRFMGYTSTVFFGYKVGMQDLMNIRPIIKVTKWCLV